CTPSPSCRPTNHYVGPPRSLPAGRAPGRDAKSSGLVAASRAFGRAANSPSWEMPRVQRSAALAVAFWAARAAIGWAAPWPASPMTGPKTRISDRCCSAARLKSALGCTWMAADMADTTPPSLSLTWDRLEDDQSRDLQLG